MLETLGVDVVFAHPERLYAIVPMVFIVLAFSAWSFQAGVKALESSPFLRLHAQEARPDWHAYLVRAFGLSALLTFLTLAWAEPENRMKIGEPVWGGVRIAFLLDTSLSMKYAHDVAPYPDRITAAKSVLADFAAMTVNDPELRGEYWRAIIPFAGTAMTYLPFSASYDEFVSAINAIDEKTISAPGTYLLGPFQEYEWMFKHYPPKSPDSVDVLVLISDGGMEEGTYEDLPYIQAALQRMPNTVVYTVGIGSVDVTTLPDGTEMRRSVKVPMVVMDRQGKVVRYERMDPEDPKSERVYRTLDERILQEIAGKEDHYVFYTGKKAFLQKIKQIIIENRKFVDTIQHKRAVSVADWFLIPALILAGIMFGYFRRLSALLMFFPSKLINRFSR